MSRADLLISVSEVNMKVIRKPAVREKKPATKKKISGEGKKAISERAHRDQGGKTKSTGPRRR